ncbi:MAG: hypothetical protein RLZ51_1534 [Pseudomonadota bacterium]|jgi:phosphonate degradation associated HDIG domain protein
MTANTSSPHPVITEIERMFEAKGTMAYGEEVNQIQHALQCGALAHAEGASTELVLAAVLHDVGHMLHRDAAGAVESGTDDHHEAIGAKFLIRGFGPAVAEPVRLHVQAKRYLCATEAGYWESLSPLSKRTLELQSGPMSDEEIRAFEALPYAADAVRLRRWDDFGKKADAHTPPLSFFLDLARRSARAA